jgi:hypothetical protein
MTANAPVIGVVGGVISHYRQINLGLMMQRWFYLADDAIPQARSVTA